MIGTFFLLLYAFCVGLMVAGALFATALFLLDRFFDRPLEWHDE